MRSSLSRFFVLFFALVLAPLLQAQREKLPPEDLEIVEARWPKATKASTGIRYIIERAGTGRTPTSGEQVAVLYTGQLLNGTTFDKSMDPTKPFTFRVGRDMVIQGWDYTVQQMRIGERRLVIIPPELAYGSRGEAPRIPRNATLVFTIELLEIKRD
ncbi:MAG: peptidylprolyl isomerase [Verrucomicrobia bacterium]|nr:peptidylprolyl isomerase [Verrucomicrobiota bacterium]